METKEVAIAKTAKTSADKSKFYIEVKNGGRILLDKETVIKYITENQAITDSEYNMFFQLCKAYKVNPFLKEAYLIKYGSAPATIVLDYKVLQQIAENNPCFKGIKSGVIVLDKNGEVLERVGAFKAPDETLLAGWCEVYRSDRDMPTKVVANFDEFKGTTKDGRLNANWAIKPCFMINKVAKAQALREAFPNLVGSNIYIAEEASSIIKSHEEEQPQRKTTITNSLVSDSDDESRVETEETAKE